MRGEAVAELRDDDDEDEVEEQLEERHPPVGRPILVPTWQLPQTPEDGRLRHRTTGAAVHQPDGRFDHDVADLLSRLDVPIGLDDLVQGYRRSMTGLNAPDSIILEMPHLPLVVLGGMGNMTLLPPKSGVISARIGFWDSGPRSDEM